ncbi:non-ribosomal peptide synthase/polyketide synthase [Pyxidicoccus fallax]|uniref:non-ribosomal peptide synthase/polyketide synthase n=1 Tax=Pyxidicoccus fallax TaxID=394095 RepID=UPI0034589C46
MQADSSDFVAPRTPTEQLLCGLFAQVLGLERVSVSSSFFDLGGHSLLATQLISRVRSSFQLELPLRELFEAPTVDALARRIDAAVSAGQTVSAPPVVRVPRTEKLPVSYSQQRVWFLDQLEPGSPAFNIPAPLELSGELHVEALRRALEALVHRHEALRTTFRGEPEGPVQVISAPASLALPVIDLSALPPEQRRAEARRLTTEDALRPFDLATGPLMRATLLKLGAREHVLLLNLHHIISDGWSIGVLVRELAALYPAFTEGRSTTLPELPLQYADYAAWQRQWLDDAELEKQLTWWRRQLDGAPQDLELPTDRPRTHHAAPRGATAPVVLSRELSEAVEALCNREGITPFMLFLSAFHLLLSRYSGQEDISVGSPVAGRNQSELEDVVGFFLNTLVLRTRLEGDPTVRELLGRVRETALGAFAHQHVPFEQLQPMRDMRQAPLFRTMFILQNAPSSELSLPGLSLRWGRPEEHVSKFDLTLALGRSAEGFTGELDYSADLFDASTAERLVRHLRALVEAMVAGPEQRLSTLQLLSAEERQRLLVDWSANPAPFPEACVHSLFEAQVRRAPDALAASFEGSRLTYAQLDQRANQLAHALRRRGVGPEVRVALSVERSLDIVVGLLGILKAGGAWVPVDPLLPRERLAFLLEDSGAAVLVTQSALLDRYPEAHRARALCLDTERLEHESTEAPATGVAPSHLAYLLYTSGSTGTPKGTAIEHRSVANLVTHEAVAYGIGPGSRVLQFANLSFDLSVEEIFTTLCSGGTLVLAPLEKLMPGAPLQKLLRDEALTVVSLTPAALAATSPEGLTELRTVISGGEALPAEVVARWAPGRRFINSYGPTEATVVATLTECVADGRVPSIGRPLANVRTYVLDARGEPVPVGVKGELYLGGVAVARGYAGRPELTAERFVPDPFAAEVEAGARMYRTGDVVRWREDGTLEFVGRADAQVKVRGFRIELGEVESALAKLPAVREAVVVAREDGPGGKRLVGYVVAREGVQTDGATLRTSLKETLPEYMVPAAVVVLPALPLTANGKVDRKALPAPDLSAAGGRPDFVAPRTPTEAQLANIWSAVLEVERVGVHDNFFELGGHSLMATQAISRMRTAFGVELPLRDLFESPTLETLAARVDTAIRAGQGIHTPPLVPAQRTGDLPLSFAQQRLWFLDQLEPDSSFYNVPATVRLEGTLDVSALERAFTELIRRHESLRTSFKSHEGQPVQVIHPPQPMTLEVVDLSTLSPEIREASVRQYAVDETQRPFRLTESPLLRARVLKVAEREHVLLLTMHHIVSDGWSMGILIQEVAALYVAFSRNQPPALPELPLQYADFTVWQRGWLRGDVLDRQVAWWREQLTGAPPALDLPTDFARPAVASFRGDIVGFNMPRALQDAVQALARREGATTFMVLLAGFQALLHRYSGQEDISIGSPIAGRGQAELERLIGFFANTLVLRTQLTEKLSFRELLAKVRETTLGAYAHQDVPFEKLVEELQPERSLNRTPLFQVLFVMQNAAKQAYDTADLRLLPVEASSGTAKFDLTLSMMETPEGLGGYLEYSSDLYARATAERMVGHLQKLLEGAVADPGQPLWKLPLLSETERHTVVQGFNAAVDPTYVPGLMHRWVEAQVARTPERIAVTDGTHSLTYAQLDARANQLAHHLVQLGVPVNGTVGLCLERSSLDMPVAVLATLKAGAAFLPLDPNYPADRLALMLEDTGAPVVLAHSQLVSALPAGLNARIIRIDEEAAAFASRPTHAPAVDMSPETNCYFVYTSGSTGRPKGIVMSHRAVGNMLWWLMKRAAKADATTLQFASLNFDVSFQEMFGTWCLGGKVLLITTPLRQDPPAMLRYMREHRVERLFLPFVALQAMCDAALSELELPPLGEVITAGEQLQVTPALVSLFERLPGCTLENQYGPSEAHVVTAWRAPADMKQWPALPPVGSPLTNVQLYVLDPHFQPCPIGVAGEVYVGGTNLAHGYYGRPDLTSDKFLPHLMGGPSGARLYRTGDKARWLADGNLEFLGRLDGQVKLRGFRIELGEVEVALRGLPGVRDAVAIVREDVPGDRRLVGYVMLPAEAPWDTEEARRVLGQRLPEYMVPSAFVRLETLPLMPTGKVARGALPPPDEESLRGAAPFTAPRNPLEEMLAEAFSEVLRVPRVSVTDNFFSLGGHSLLATQVISRVRKGLGVELPLRALFEAPSVESLAALLQREQQSQQARPPAPEQTMSPVNTAPAQSAAVKEPRKEAAPWSPLVPLRDGDTARAPLYLVHPLDGDVRCYAELTAHAPAGQRVVGIQARGLEDGRAPLESIEAMAALYVEALRAAQPQGPYLLAGWAMGGVVAWEMAQQLQRDGEEVDLVLVEPGPATPDRGSAASAAAAQAALFAKELAALAGVEPLVLPRELTTGKDAEPLLQHLLTEGPKAGLLSGDVSLAELRARFKVFSSHLRAARRYLPEPYAGKARMLRAAEAPDLDEDVRDRGWGELTEGGLDVQETPGDGYSLLRAPHVAELVKRLLGVDGSEPPTSPGGGGGGTLPLSFAQQRLWFIDQLSPNSPAYNISSALRLTGPLRHDVLERAFTELVRRHQALRASFLDTPQGPVQEISEPAPFAVPLEDLRSVPVDQQDAETRRRLEDEARLPFNLASGPLLRARALRLGEQDHVLVLVIHHIISDAWSMGILVRELTSLYLAFMVGRPSPLPELPVQYSDYVRWQRGWLTGEVLEGQLSYWRKQLGSAPVALELPTDRPRPAMQSFRGATLPVDLSRPVSDAVRALCAREGATPFMALLAGFQLLLSRYSGQDDVVVGSTIAGRNRAEYEGLIGFFVNTLALRTRLTPGLTFRQLLARVKETTLDAYAHQELPFEKIVEVLQPDRDLGRPPFFQGIFTLENTQQDGAQPGVTGAGGPGFSIRPLDIETRVSRMDLTLLLTDTPQGYRGGLEYDTDLFDGPTAERLVRHLRVLMEGLVTAPDRPIANVSLLSTDERRQVLVDWNATATDYPRDTPIHTLFARQAALTPDAVAVVFGDARLTYAELDARANQLAHHLRASGVAPGSRVGVCLERSLELVVALLGVLKAGGAYVPVDRTYPVERITFLLQQAGVGVLLTQEHVADELPALGQFLVCLDSEWTQVARWPQTPPEVEVSADSLAYVMFTSGSTGQPKGVSVSHRGVVRLVRGSSFIQFGPEHTFLQLAPVAFDASTLEVWGALLNGGRLVMAPPHKPSLEELGELFARHGVTTLWLTAALFEQVVLHQGEALAHVRQVLAGGDVLPAARVRQHLERLGDGAVLVNGYGPTENTTFSATHTLRRGSDVGASVPIGRPLSNSTAYVLDASMQPVPVGVPGELYVGGDGLAWGYLGRPDLTAERFVPHPFSAIPGARLYRTGDRVRWRKDGTLDFLGRTDFQVKVRGFRIEPGEVEAVVRQFAGVREAVVVVREDVPGDKRLVAYVVAETDEELESRAVRAFLQQKLPEYLVPSAVVVLPALPLSPNGKVDRKALPAPDAPASDEAIEYVAPRTEAERQLALFFSELLRAERVGAHDSFFDLGGHSLLATQLVSRVRAAFGVEMPLRDLFEAPTVAGLAERLEAARRSGEGLQAPPLTPVPRSGPLPLSFAQQRLWFLDRLEPGSPFYNIPAALRLDGALDVEALGRALQELVHRHEALRTTFHVHEDAPVQAVHAHAELPLPVVDLGHLPEEEREARALKLAYEEAQKPFDLTRAPLLRTTLLRLSERRHVLLFTVHHIVADGWSIGVLIREVGALYPAFSTGLPSPLEPLTLQYADYAAWQRGWLRDEVLDKQVAWWKQQLAGLPHALELPTDRPRPPVQTFRGTNVPVRISGERMLALQALCRREGVTPFMVLLSAFHVLLSRYSGQDDIVVGSPIANRRQADLENIVGFFVNTLALRARLTPGMTFRELLAQVRESTLGAYTHQDVPFEKLVDELRPERDLSRSPLFQVMLALQNTPPARQSEMGLTLSPVEVDSGTAKFDLSFLLADYESEISGTLEYNTDLFAAETARRMVAHLMRLLDEAASDPGRAVARLPMLGDEERHRLLVEWNSTAKEPHAPVLMHRPVEAQAARTPDAVAVTDGTRSLTYAELDSRANRLANHLVHLGVPAGGTVGLCLDKGLEMAVAVLATLKAGAAYLPLDPNYPAERLTFMLEDAGAPVVLTEAHLASALPSGTRARVVCVDTEAEAIARRSAQAPARELSPEATCYLIYTSGSTGRPKGVALPHRALSHLMTWQLKQSVKADATTLQFASLSFDVSCQELFSTWWAGGTLVLPTGGLRQDMPALLDFMARTGVERMFLPFVALQALADATAHGATLPRSLREVVTAGEQLQVTPALVAFFEKLPGCVLENQYGPSETHVVSAHRLQGAPASWPRLPSIGGPLPHTQLHVLDAQGQPCPVGVPGELCIGGAHLAHGYFGRSELTAEKFVPHPFSDVPGARLYRTGDSARWKADGTVEFLGRLDGQVKLRGFRVELGEVESALRAAPGVRDAAAVVREDVPGDKRLVAYVIPAPGTPTVDTSALRDFLKQRLPEYMVPSAFVTLEALPLTPSGKLARRMLPAPDAESLRGDAPFTAPRTPMEERLAELYSGLLRLPRVSVTDSFFALGGHSLMATQLMSRVRSALGVELPLRTLFESPTIEGLAAAIQRAGQPVAEAPGPAMTGGNRTEAPLSFAQQRLWFLDRLSPGGAAYNLATALRLTGPLDLDILERVLTELARRHHVLRTTFRDAEEGPLQVIHPPAPVRLAIDDLRALSPEAREAEAPRLATEEVQQPFHLEQGPLWRARVLWLGAQDHVFVLTMHHAISDGWSLGVLVEELTALYAAFATGRPSPLPELPLQYADYSVWQREWLRGEVLERQIAFWRQQLAGAPAALELPTDRPRPAMQTTHGASLPVRLPASLSRALADVCQREGVTPFMALLAAWQSLLSRYSGQDDILVGSPIAGRTRAEHEPLIGFFINTLVLRARLTPGLTFRELLAQVKETTLGAYAHQDVPFEKLVEALQPPRDPSRSPFFQVGFVLQNTPLPPAPDAVLRVEPVSVDTNTVKNDLHLSLADGPEGLGGSLEYSTDLFDAPTVERLMRHFQALLEALLLQPGLRIDRAPLLTPEERRRVLVDWNDTRVAPPLDTCVHSLFEAQAARTPDAEAVTFEGRSLSYRELDARANQLAHHLRSLGVGPDVPVALCVERSVELVVGMLGILKAGGAFVPMDPSHPSERLGFVLADSAVPVVVTQEPIADELPTRGELLVLLDADEALLARQPTTAPVTRTAAESLAYVIYTSGSTGRPKGTLLHHRGLCNTALAAAKAHGFRPGSRVLQFAAATFDAAVCEVFSTLLAGATLVLAPRERLLPDAPLRGLLEEQRITAVTLTPSVLAQLEPRGLPSLETVISAGEALPADVARRWSERRVLLNAYGPTEVTVCAAITPYPGLGRPVLTAEVPHLAKPSLDTTPGATSQPQPSVRVTLGRAWPNTRLYVLDAHLQPVPVGVAGELYVGGVGLARGYLRRPELTAERFVPDPFGDTAGARLYRTGDRVRWLLNGELEYLGRDDGQVKLRGFRIETGEVEAALTAHASVQHAAVQAREDANGEKRLVAYVVPHDGQSIEPDVLRAFLTTRLPEYMLPAAFVPLAALPLTVHGKLDTRALPSPEETGLATASRPLVPPRDALEEQLVRLWEELLGMSPIGVQNDFFELGGHSLLAVRMMSRIRERTGHDLPVSALFQGATVERLAALLRQRPPESPTRASPVVTLRSGSAGHRPLFLVHPIGGNVFCYADLARALDGQRPILGLEAPLPSEAPSSMEALAAAHLRHVREVQPTGPYLLGGWSLGGVVALEMARQLQSQGEVVELLALIDPSPVTATPEARGSEPEEAVHAAGLFALDLAHVAGVPLGLPATLPEGLTPERILEHLLTAARQAGVALPGGDLPSLQALFATFRSNLEALRGYAARTYTGPTLLVRAADSEDARDDRGWTRVLPDVTPQGLPGDHYSLLRVPRVSALAEHLDTALRGTSTSPKP